MNISVTASVIYFLYRYALKQKKGLFFSVLITHLYFQVFDLYQCGALCVALFTTKVVLHTSVWASRVGHTVGTKQRVCPRFFDQV